MIIRACGRTAWHCDRMFWKRCSEGINRKPASAKTAIEDVAAVAPPLR